MKSCTSFLTVVAIFTLVSLLSIVRAESASPSGYAGSASCQECHENFYTLWSNSRHRNTIIPYSDDFAKKELLTQKTAITIGKYSYLADIRPGAGKVLEAGPDGAKEYRIEYALGGKKLYSFLTTLENGRIESLPLGYDLTKKEWYEAENAIDAPAPDGEKKLNVYWQNYPFFVSEACPSCHVSRFAISYDQKQKRYSETWNEPGINCETCHGPSKEHNVAMRNVPKGTPVGNPKIISVKKMGAARRSDLCVTCHAKQVAITATYNPGDRYFDHYDLTMLESNEFYPDGRDQGENYTMTGWMMNKCVKDGKPDCMHCHTSSGRYRFKDTAKANDACLPCHAERVKNVARHSHHKIDGPGSYCISCHMPKTIFARMQWSDHSLSPPSPKATLEFGSPNACTLCHKEKDAAWANNEVRAWFPDDYQEAILKPARLISAARKRDWTKLPDMLAYLKSNERGEVNTASLIRLLRWCRDERVAPALRSALQDELTLVRAAAAESLGAYPSAASAAALLVAATDDYRLVRVKAAASLNTFPRNLLAKDAAQKVQRAFDEYLASLMLEPDKSGTWLTIGNYRLKRDEFADAATAFQSALDLAPRSVQALLNLAYIHYRLGNVEKATGVLATAIEIEPDNKSTLTMAKRFSFGPASLDKANTHFSELLKYNPRSAQAAYGLCMVSPANRLSEALDWCRKAVELAPEEKKYSGALKRKMSESKK